jgi:hypothetical protein
VAISEVVTGGGEGGRVRMPEFGVELAEFARSWLAGRQCGYDPLPQPAVERRSAQAAEPAAQIVLC